MEKQILLIDDDPEVRATTQELLIRKGFAVTTVENGEDALKLLPTVSVDLIIIDYRLPGQNGDVITDRIKSQPEYAHIPILMCTAQATLAQPLGGNPRLIKPNAFLIKPFGADKLLSQVRLLTSG